MGNIHFQRYADLAFATTVFRVAPTLELKIMRPVNHLNAAGHMYPAAWKLVDDFRASRGVDLPDWPQWCFLPLAGWYTIVSEGKQISLNRVPDIGRLAAIGTWRYSQGIYRFDDHVYEAIKDTIPSGEMPVDVLYRLPEWCIYIETPGTKWMGDTLYGFWAHLEFDMNEKRPELRLVLDTENALLPLPLHLGKWTMTEAVDRAFQETVNQSRKIGFPLPTDERRPDELAAELYGLVSLVLYLCSEEPEIDDEREPGAYPQRPRPTRTKKGWRLFPAKRPRMWTVASKLGDQLRQAANPGDATGKGKAPHLRRAHWHGFWTGPKDGERKFIYKWLPPVAVGVGPQ